MMTNKGVIARAAMAALGEMYGLLYQSREMVLEIFTEKMNDRGCSVFWMGSRSSAWLGSRSGDVITIRCNYDRAAGWTPAAALLNGDDFWKGVKR